MSKITPKNLHYDSSLPPFLARLQANNASSDGRHEFSIARPKKSRNADEDAEDEPVYFNEESGETLTKSEWEAKEAADEEAKGQLADAEGKTVVGKPEGGGGATGGAKEGKEKIAAIGAAKKRKAGKVVGAEEGDDVEGEEEEAGKKAGITPQAQAQASKTEGKKGEKMKPAKKAKKIKLSFDD
jgi:hypothetical protein